MLTNKKFQILKVLLVVFLFGAVSTTKGQTFTITSYWETGSKLYYTSKTTEDYEGDSFDNEYIQEGSYVFDGLDEDGRAKFNISESNTFIHDAIIIEEGFFVRIAYSLNSGDSIEYEFGMSPGTIDFLIFEEDQYELWRKPETTDQAEALFSLSTTSGDKDTFNATTSGTYYLVWFNDDKIVDNSIYVQFELQTNLAEFPLVGTSTLDPITLETEEGVKIDDFAMDTSGWKIGDTISIEIGDRSVEFSITREEDLTIPINNVTASIPTWVLEKLGYKRDFLGQEHFSIEADYTIWKSKFSGTNLQSTQDVDILDENSSLLTISYSKFTVTSIEKVAIAPKTTSFYFLPILIAITLLIGYKRIKERLKIT
ncbi:MAG: hypothetical protein ACFFFG_08880 [Candidatus Thorarchaeota archaeon]